MHAARLHSVFHHHLSPVYLCRTPFCLCLICHPAVHAHIVLNHRLFAAVEQQLPQLSGSALTLLTTSLPLLLPTGGNLRLWRQLGTAVQAQGSQLTAEQLCEVLSLVQVRMVITCTARHCGVLPEKIRRMLLLISAADKTQHSQATCMPYFWSVALGTDKAHTPSF